MPGGALALIPVRDGVIAPPGLEVAAAIDGTPLLVGEKLGMAAGSLAGIVDNLLVAETSESDPGRVAAALAPLVGRYDYIVLPGTPDGRDLGARLAAELGWPYAGTAVSVAPGEALVPRHGGELMARLSIDGPFVTTLQAGLTTIPNNGNEVVSAVAVDLGIDPATSSIPAANVLRIEGPDAATMDLAEAPRIVGGGAGMMVNDDDAANDAAARFDALGAVGLAIGASMGATRVVTDAGWVPHSRQIGTTGVVVDPELYLAFGISGAVQHTAGLGHPEHVISVNTDPHCPMMSMADLAVVADANATVAALADLLGTVEE